MKDGFSLVRSQSESESGRLRVDGGVAVELGGQVVGFGFGSGSRGHTEELRGLCVSLPDFAKDLQPREAEPRISRRCVVKLDVKGEVAGELSRFARFVAAGEVQELVEEGYLRFDLCLKKKKKKEEEEEVDASNFKVIH